MKSLVILLAPLLLLAMFACEEDPKLGPSLSDVRSAAPTVCKDYCAWAQGCVWEVFNYQYTGVELPKAQQDWQQSCVVTCANRAHRGSFFYEAEWDTEAEQLIVDFTEAIDGKLFTGYFECLWDNSFWDCGEHGPELLIDSEQACSNYNACVQILDGAMQYNWNPDGNGGQGDCHHEGFDNLWSGNFNVW